MIILHHLSVQYRFDGFGATYAHSKCSKANEQFYLNVLCCLFLGLSHLSNFVDFVGFAHFSVVIYTVLLSVFEFKSFK